MSYDEITEQVSLIADSFRTHSAVIGCSMFYTIAMLIDRTRAAWPDPQAVGFAATLWGIAIIVQCFVFEETRRRTARRLHATLRTWYLRGPGARGASVIDAEPLGITYEDLGRRKRAAIAFFWSRIEFVIGSAETTERAGTN